MCKYREMCEKQMKQTEKHVEQALFIGDMICSLLDIKKENGQDIINLQ